MLIQQFLHAQYNPYAGSGDPRFSFCFHSCDMSEYGYILLAEQSIEIAPPEEKELVRLHICMLRAKEKGIQAEAYQKCQQVREEIQKLLAIENHLEEIL